MKKIIKTSKRGLTFSVDNTKDFEPGSRYSYIVGDNQIIIKSCEEGKLKVSRKKSGNKIKALFDLRSRMVVDKVKNADYMEVEVRKDTILVRFCKKASKVVFHKKEQLYQIDSVLAEHTVAEYEIPRLLMASGMSTYQQLTLEDYFSSVSNLSQTHSLTQKEINTIKRDISDVFSVVSLFSGAGMFDYPFALDDSFRIRFACDICKDAVKSYEENIGIKPFCGDVRDVINIGQADVVLGGPSCKAFSNANRSKTRLLDHPDFFLIKEYVRIVKESMPSVFVIENVPEFVTAGEGELLAEVLAEFKNYDITVNKVCDGDVGGYTQRKRVFVIGSKVGSIVLPTVKMMPQKTVSEALAKVDSSWFNFGDITKSKRDTVEKMAYVKDGGNWEDVPEELRGKSVHSSYLRRLHPDRLSPTLTNFRKTCLLPPTSSPNPNRILSVAEASALSGFPKEFHFLGTLSERQQQVGNGVPFALGKLVMNSIKNALKKRLPSCC